MLLLLRRPKQEAINWRQRKWLQVSKPGKVPYFSPPPKHFPQVGLVPPPLPHSQELNAVRTSNFQIHTMKGGWGQKTTNVVHKMAACRREETKWQRKCRPAPWLQNNMAASARQTPHRVQRRKEIPSTCSQAVECLLLYRLLWEAGAIWIHQETSYLQDP